MSAVWPAKSDHPFRSDSEVAELVRLFESCQLPYERWTHRAHLAIAADYLRRYSLHEATGRIRSGIRRYNESRGDGTGYHETITLVFVRLVARELDRLPPAGPAEIANELAGRFKGAAVLVYYSPERLWSAAARAGWIEPDRKPLDF